MVQRYKKGMNNQGIGCKKVSICLVNLSIYHFINSKVEIKYLILLYIIYIL